MFKKQHSLDSGYALVVFLVIVAIGMFILANSLNLAKTSTRTNYAARVRSDEFFATDKTMNLAVNWFRSQSLNMITPFQKENFYSTFTLGAPSVGANDVSEIAVPTKIKTAGNNSVILSTDSTLGSSNFPATQNILTGTSFDAVSDFAAQNFGEPKFRATLVDAVPVDPSQDYGPPPAGAPVTDFYPIYRLDSIQGVNEGTRLLGYMVGSLFYVDAVGFYGRDFVQAMQTCDSYISANGPYGTGSKRAHCPVGSNGEVRVHQNEEIYGSVRTNGTINTASPYGGPICSDFSCSNPGTTCEGPTCAVPGLPTFSTWAEYCPTDQGNRNVNSNQTWTVAGSAANQKCWATVTLGNNRQLTLTSTGTGNAYFIRSLTIPNNARLNIAPNPASATVYLYVETLNDGSFNGNQVYNINNRPSQFRLYYLGTQALKLNGTAAMNLALVAPYSSVEVTGNFTFQGGIIAKDLTFSGSGAVHYDESLGGSSLNDINYRLRDKIQYYN